MLADRGLRSRDVRLEEVVTLRLIADVAGAVRALRATPGTSATIVLTVAVAVGINLAMVELVERALFSTPAGILEPDRIFTVDFETTSPTGERILNAVTSYRMFQAIREHVPALEGASAVNRLPILSC